MAAAEHKAAFLFEATQLGNSFPATYITVFLPKIQKV